MRDHSDDWLARPSEIDERLAELEREIEKLRQKHMVQMDKVSVREIGLEYLDALEAAQDTKTVCKTNNGDSYDPCGTTRKRLASEFEETILRLAKATDALIGLTKNKGPICD